MLPPSRPLEVDLVAPPPKSVPVAQTLQRVKPAVSRPPVRPMSPVPVEPPPPSVEEPITQPENPPLPITESVTEPLTPEPPVPVNPPRFDAAYLNNPKPEYPRAAKKLGLQGTVLLRVLVSAAGQVEQINILTSSGVASLDEVAMNTVKHWTFVPARQGDRAIAGAVNVPIRFTLN